MLLNCSLIGVLEMLLNCSLIDVLEVLVLKCLMVKNVKNVETSFKRTCFSGLLAEFWNSLSYSKVSRRFQGRVVKRYASLLIYIF